MNKVARYRGLVAYNSNGKYVRYIDYNELKKANAELINRLVKSEKAQEFLRGEATRLKVALEERRKR